MAGERYFDEYMDKLEIETEEINETSNQRILENTLHRLNEDNISQKVKPAARWKKVRYIVAVCLVLILLSGLIPSTPVNALYRSVFKFIPGVGIVESEEGTSISMATGQAYKVESENGFLEIKYAYIQNDCLNISAVFNVGYTDIEDFSNKEEIIEKTRNNRESGIYLLSGDEKIYIKNYSRSGPSLETGAVKLFGSILLEEELLDETTFVLGMDRLDKRVQIELKNVDEGYSPDELGSCLYIDDILIFADLYRKGDVAILNMSSVIPEQYDRIRFYHTDEIEKALFESGIKIVDDNGKSYYPDDGLRKKNNDTGNNFYFEIPEDEAGLKVVIPQFFYDTKVIGDIVVKMPKLDEYINIDEVFVFDSMSLNFKGLTLLTEEDELVNREFGENTLRLDFEAHYDEDSIHRVSRIVPRIKIKTGFNDYDPVSASGHFPYWELDQQEGSYYTVFDGMDDASKILVEIKMTNTIIGPFEIEL